MPFFDKDTNVLFLAGKGDGNIRYYEVVDEAPYIYFLSEFKSKDPQRGMCMLPKRAVNVSDCEIVRLCKLGNKLMEPVSFQVPRKVRYCIFARNFKRRFHHVKYDINYFVLLSPCIPFYIYAFYLRFFSPKSSKTIFSQIASPENTHSLLMNGLVERMENKRLDLLLQDLFKRKLLMRSTLTRKRKRSH